jgi:hypothetical protein
MPLFEVANNQVATSSDGLNSAVAQSHSRSRHLISETLGLGLFLSIRFRSADGSVSLHGQHRPLARILEQLVASTTILNGFTVLHPKCVKFWGNSIADGLHVPCSMAHIASPGCQSRAFRWTEGPDLRHGAAESAADFQVPALGLHRPPRLAAPTGTS